MFIELRIKNMITVFSWLEPYKYCFNYVLIYLKTFTDILFYFYYFLQIVVTVAEHHSAIVPWQLVAQKTGAILKFVSLTEDEVPDIDKLKEMITRKTKLLVVHHISNVLGR